MTEYTLENFEGLRDNATVSFDLMAGYVVLLAYLTAYSPTSRPTATSSCCRGSLSAASSKSKLSIFANCSARDRYYKADFISHTKKSTTYERHFGGRLIAWTGFEQE